MLSRLWQLIMAALALATVTSLVVPRAYANGSATRFERQVAGLYEIALSTRPGSPSVGSIHLTMTVADAFSKRFIMDAEVSLVGRSPETGAAALGPLVAEKTLTDPAFYDVTTTVDREGTWVFTVKVSGELGDASADFPVEVRSASVLTGIATLVMLVTLLSIFGMSMRAHIRRTGSGKSKRKSRTAR